MYLRFISPEEQTVKGNKQSELTEALFGTFTLQRFAGVPHSGRRDLSTKWEQRLSSGDPSANSAIKLDDKRVL